MLGAPIDHDPALFALGSHEFVEQGSHMRSVHAYTHQCNKRVLHDVHLLGEMTNDAMTNDQSDYCFWSLVIHQHLFSVIFLMHFLQLRIRHVRIDLRRTQVFMSQHLLHAPQIRSVP